MVVQLISGRPKVKLRHFGLGLLTTLNYLLIITDPLTAPNEWLSKIVNIIETIYIFETALPLYEALYCFKLNSFIKKLDLD